VLIHGRDEGRGEDILNEIREATGNERLYWLRADLSSLADPPHIAQSGGYYDGLRLASPHPQARDDDARRRLRELSDRLCGLDRAATAR
jgi:hypothetical protein